MKASMIRKKIAAQFHAAKTSPAFQKSVRALGSILLIGATTLPTGGCTGRYALGGYDPYPIGGGYNSYDTTDTTILHTCYDRKDRPFTCNQNDEPVLFFDRKGRRIDDALRHRRDYRGEHRDYRDDHRDWRRDRGDRYDRYDR